VKRYDSEQIKEFISKPLFCESTLLNRDSQYPKISVVTPSFNQGHFLERTILSVLNQNYPNLEYVIMDGGSTDESPEIIRKYERYLSYWVSERDRGQADGINKGFSRASGEILAWLNSDDLYLPNALHQVASAMTHDRSIQVLYGNLYRIDADDHILEEKRLTPFSGLGYLYGGCDLAQPSAFWRREIFSAVGGLKEEIAFSMDTDLFFRFVLACARFRFLREFLACFRVQPSSKTSRLQEISKSDNLKIRGTYLKYSYGSIPARLIRTSVRMKRVFWYALQGDIDWVFERACKRLREKVSQGAVP
jgi:glycosyltransferase involved in cell wall biosynthesis